MRNLRGTGAGRQSRNTDSVIIPCHRCKRPIPEVRFGSRVIIACCDDCLTHYYGSPAKAHQALADELMAANLRAKKRATLGDLPEDDSRT